MTIFLFCDSPADVSRFDAAFILLEGGVVLETLDVSGSIPRQSLITPQ